MTTKYNPFIGLLPTASCSTGPMTFVIPMLVFSIVPRMYLDALYRGQVPEIITHGVVYSNQCPPTKERYIQKKKKKVIRGCRQGKIMMGSYVYLLGNIFFCILKIYIYLKNYYYYLF